MLLALSDGMKARTLPGFGPQLAQIRKARGLTQTELGQKLGVSQRVVAYYEQADAQPPGPLLLDLAQALQVSTDELLGRRPLKTPRRARRPSACSSGCSRWRRCPAPTSRPCSSSSTLWSPAVGAPAAMAGAAGPPPECFDSS